MLMKAMEQRHAWPRLVWMRRVRARGGIEGAASMPIPGECAAAANDAEVQRGTTDGHRRFNPRGQQ